MIKLAEGKDSLLIAKIGGFEDYQQIACLYTNLGCK